MRSATGIHPAENYALNHPHHAIESSTTSIFFNFYATNSECSIREQVPRHCATTAFSTFHDGCQLAETDIVFRADAVRIPDIRGSTMRIALRTQH